MASRKDPGGERKGNLESAEENLASLRSTLAELDSVSERWEVIRHAVGGCIIFIGRARVLTAGSCTLITSYPGLPPRLYLTAT